MLSRRRQHHNRWTSRPRYDHYSPADYGRNSLAAQRTWNSGMVVPPWMRQGRPYFKHGLNVNDSFDANSYKLKKRTSNYTCQQKSAPRLLTTRLRRNQPFDPFAFSAGERRVGKKRSQRRNQNWNNQNWNRDRRLQQPRADRYRPLRPDARSNTSKTNSSSNTEPSSNTESSTRTDPSVAAADNPQENPLDTLLSTIAPAMAPAVPYPCRAYGFRRIPDPIPDISPARYHELLEYYGLQTFSSCFADDDDFYDPYTPDCPLSPGTPPPEEADDADTGTATSDDEALDRDIDEAFAELGLDDEVDNEWGWDEWGWDGGDDDSEDGNRGEGFEVTDEHRAAWDRWLAEDDPPLL
ncbi:hypothetical protein HK104_010335 [Borealophlyctis nickersoniae]|nr:hypothetical protein HK104_010335 [Borealophlyctis nickersoniae]